MARTRKPPGRKRKSRATGRFDRFVKAQAPNSAALPLVHITRAYSFDEMIYDDKLFPAYCDVFGEDLIYLFYGRPAYRAKDGNNARLEFEWPIIFVFYPEKIGKLRRIFPFDTGATRAI